VTASKPETAAAKRKRLRLQRRGYRLKATYGIDNQDYEVLLKAQGGKCAICGGRRPYYLHVDHDHSVRSKRRSVRGLLCKRCNNLLARVRDDVALLGKAAEYLASPPARGVL